MLSSNAAGRFGVERGTHTEPWPAQNGTLAAGDSGFVSWLQGLDGDKTGSEDCWRCGLRLWFGLLENDDRPPQRPCRDNISPCETADAKNQRFALPAGGLQLGNSYIANLIIRHLEASTAKSLIIVLDICVCACILYAINVQ